MKCEDRFRTIEEYLDGELDGQASEMIGIHLARCPTCSAYRGAIERETGLYAGYQRNVEVEPELWRTIQARIRDEKAAGLDWTARVRSWISGSIVTPRFSPALAALIVLLTVGITVAVMSYLNGSTDSPDEVARKDESGANQDADTSKRNTEPHPGETALATGTATGADGGRYNDSSTDSKGSVTGMVAESGRRKARVKRPVFQEHSPEQLIREAEEKYTTAIGLLTRDVRNRRTKLSDEELLRFESTLAAIDRAIAETRHAVRTNPEDPVALQYLLAAYSKKVDVLREMARD